MTAMQKQNRIMAKQPKWVREICGACDQSCVAPGQKCPVCQARSGKRRFKKVPVTEEG